MYVSKCMYVYECMCACIHAYVYEHACVFGLVSLFNGISTLMGYLMPKSSIQKNSSDTIKPIAGEIRGLCIYPTPPHERMWYKVNFKRSLNSEFSFSYFGCCYGNLPTRAWTLPAINSNRYCSLVEVNIPADSPDSRTETVLLVTLSFVYVFITVC